MKVFFANLGKRISAFFKDKIVTKILAWPRFLQILVPSLAGVVVVGAVGGTVAYHALHGGEEVAENTETETESISEMSEETETESEYVPQYFDQMVVDIEVPTYQTCYLTGASIVRDLTLYFFDTSDTRIQGTAFSVKMMTSDQAASLSSYTAQIDQVTALIEEAQALEAAGESTEELKTRITDELGIDFSMAYTDVDTVITYITVDENGDVVDSTENASESEDTTDSSENDAESDDTSSDASEEATSTSGEAFLNSDLASDEEKMEEYTEAYDTTYEELSLSEQLSLYKTEVVAAYAEALENVDATVYTDEDANGIIEITYIKAGDYAACLIPVDNYLPTSYATSMNVKDEPDYIPVEHVEEKAEVADVEEEEAVVEETKVVDTVTYIESSKKLNLPTYASTTSISAAPVVSSTYTSASYCYGVTEDDGLDGAGNDSSETESETESQSESETESQSETESESLDKEVTVIYTASDVLTLTDSVTMYPLNYADAKTAKIKYTFNNTYIKDSLSVKSDTSGVGATLNSDGTITITLTKYADTLAGKTAKITLTGTVAEAYQEAFNESANTTNSYDYTKNTDGTYSVSVACTITFKSAKTELTSADGDALYVDNTHSSSDRTAVTVGTYKAGQSYFYETAEEYYTYYGWQIFNKKRYYYDENGVVVTGDQVINGSTYRFGTDGALMTSGTGIDVSKWDGTIDWDTAADYVDFVIVRCGYGSHNSAEHIMYQDVQFENNVTGLNRVGVPYGLYFYSSAKTEAEAIEEASLAIEMANKAGGVTLPIYYDWEWVWLRENLSVEQATANAVAFCKTIENGGYQAGIYSSRSFYYTNLDVSQLTSYSIWVAEYNTECKYYLSNYDMWQYSSTGSIPGINASVDMNISYFSK